jgi:hypothetical protein
MKKVLVLMGAFLAFAACTPLSDCDSTISADMVSVDVFTEDAATIVEFEKPYEEATWDDVTLPEEWADAAELGLTLSCVER